VGDIWPKEKGHRAVPFFMRLDPSEIDNGGEHGGSENKNQPLQIVARQKTGEVQNQYGYGKQIEQSKQHRTPLFASVGVALPSKASRVLTSLR
jgi:hypothetical protein